MGKSVWPEIPGSPSLRYVVLVCDAITHQSQWFIASSKPPSLAAIAPWEGSSDAYRDNARRGGMPDTPMAHGVGILCPGRGLQEDHAMMARENEFFNTYWEGKRAKLGRITCPAYVLASYSSKLHGAGSVRGWKQMASKEKWYGLSYDCVVSQF